MNFIRIENKNIQHKNPILQLVTDALFPRRCPVCDRPVNFGSMPVHAECLTEFRRVGSKRCMKCGTPLLKEEDEYCNNCGKFERNFERCFSAFIYDSTMQKTIFKYKYGGRREYAQYLGYALYRETFRDLEKIRPDCLIPVPLHRDKLKKRGFNQAELLAKRVGELANIRVRTDLVERIRYTTPQKELGLYERRKNLKRAFKIKKNDVNYNSIVIVDDIYTTGSTIDEISAAFKQCGNTRVYGLTLATGAPR
ncbi:MAG: ComF family protein [Lachnospiraceae bacterium]|nr:ComF family protein [Lachnospiraceae bacterium]